AGDALRGGRGSELARANLFTALLLANGIPARQLGCISSRTGGDLYYLNEVHAGAPGWLRFDTLARTATPFPWPELEAGALLEIDADRPAKGGMRPHWCECRGGLTAGPKGAVAWSVSDRLATTISRAAQKEILPVLVQAFGEVQGEWRKSGE